MKAPSAPRLIYGTAWKEERTEELTALALTAGFRAIDAANQRKHYFEAAVGAAVQRALAEGLLTRDELFLQSKCTFRSGQDHRLPYDAQAPIAVQVEQSLQSSLEHFQTSYLHGAAHRYLKRTAHAAGSARRGARAVRRGAPGARGLKGA